MNRTGSEAAQSFSVIKFLLHVFGELGGIKIFKLKYAFLSLQNLAFTSVLLLLNSPSLVYWCAHLV